MGELMPQNRSKLIFIQHFKYALVNTDPTISLGPTKGKGIGDGKPRYTYLGLGKVGSLGQVSHHMVQLGRFILRHPLHLHHPAHQGRTDKILDGNKDESQNNIERSTSSSHPGAYAGDNSIEDAKQQCH